MQPSRNRDDRKNLAVVRTTAPLAEIMKKAPKNFYAIGKFIIAMLLQHWNRKFIRAIQAVLNSTKGKVGKGKHFFEEAFGADEHRFWTILWMPETFIIYRFMFKENLAKEWEEKFWSLPTEELEKVKSVVAVNKFKDLDFSKYSKKARDVLQYYMVTRDEAEQMLKEKNS